MTIRAAVLAVALTGTMVPLAGAGDEARIREARAESNRAIQAGDAAGFAKSLDGDFVVVTGNGSLLTREQYVAAFARDFEDAQSMRFERVLDTVEVASSEPLAAEHGHWLGRVNGGAPMVGGTYLAMWRKTGDRWKLRSELFVSLTCGSAADCEKYRKRHHAVGK
jgi:ketosteroid isomerase-like protein